ncbi:MAG: DUF1189 domain-containing protein [Elusimicrobiota bacterium]|jgi:hypothetical protein|nr:DUF1189 domain-containing protein [Elusimicrobiota bacterium]
MLTGPLKALYNIGFYVDGIGRSAKRAILFVLYLFLICCFIMAIATYFQAKPVLNRALDTIASYTPDISVQDGIVSVNNDNMLVIEPEELDGYNIVFDTGSTAPVYPTEMATNDTVMQITADTVYVNFMDQFQATKLPPNTNTFITKDTVLEGKPATVQLLLYFFITILIIAQLFKVPFMLLFAFLMAAIINTIAKAGIKAKDLFKFACYVQAPATLLFLLNYISPIKIPFLIFIYLLVFVIYAQLVFSRLNPSAENNNGGQNGDGEGGNNRNLTQTQETDEEEALEVQREWQGEEETDTAEEMTEIEQDINK